uniref:Putative secreted protein n=1 Tax=Ixodes ricinus TaxID=34613 RepID=A0A6B0UJ22_IXORI
MLRCVCSGSRLGRGCCGAPALPLAAAASPDAWTSTIFRAMLPFGITGENALTDHRRERAAARRTKTTDARRRYEQHWRWSDRPPRWCMSHVQTCTRQIRKSATKPPICA